MSNPSKSPKYEALENIVLEKPGNPASRREIKTGQAFDATEEELRNLVIDQQYRIRS